MRANAILQCMGHPKHFFGYLKGLFVHCSQVVHGAHVFVDRTFKILNASEMHGLFSEIQLTISIAQHVRIE